MFFYHVNVGYPLLDEGSRYLAPIRDVVWAAHAGARYARRRSATGRMPAPRPDFREQVWQHEIAADAGGEVPVAVVNDRLGARLRGGDPQGPAALLLRVAEFSGRRTMPWASSRRRTMCWVTSRRGSAAR